MIFSYLLNMQSHPSWVCGLKLSVLSRISVLWCHTLRGCVDWNLVTRFIAGGQSMVTPFVGVWIETLIYLHVSVIMKVTPFVGVWIETRYRLGILQEISGSHPSWVCGLKHKSFQVLFGSVRHTLRGCVDWNCWYWLISSRTLSHTLRGCVDWNITGGIGE